MLDPHHPIGKFAPKESYSQEDISRNIERIENCLRNLPQLRGNLATANSIRRTGKKGGQGDR